MSNLSHNSLRAWPHLNDNEELNLLSMWLHSAIVRSLDTSPLVSLADTNLVRPSSDGCRPKRQQQLLSPHRIILHPKLQ